MFVRVEDHNIEHDFSRFTKFVIPSPSKTAFLLVHHDDIGCVWLSFMKSVYAVKMQKANQIGEIKG